MARPEVLRSLPRRGARPLSISTAALRTRALVEPLTIWGLTRVLFAGLTYFGLILFNSDFHTAHPSFLHQLLPAWNQWDTKWYESIAQRGYHWHPTGVATEPTAFFPLYPLLMRAVVIVTHRSYLTAALLVANACALAAFWYLWRLATFEFDREVAGRAVLYIAVFPTALYFFAGYTESLFLLLTVASFYHLRREQWLAAGIFAALAAATRVTGVLLVLPLLWEYGRSHEFFGGRAGRRRLDWGIIGVLIAPVGLLAFMLYLQYAVGDALAFSHNQAGWQKIFTLALWQGPYETLRQIVDQPPASFFQAWNIIDGALGIGMLAASVFAARRLAPAYGIYLAAFWLVTLTSPAIAGGYPVPLVSFDRYVIVLFPVFLWLGSIGKRRSLHDAYLVGSVALLSVLTVVFVNGHWAV